MNVLLGKARAPLEAWEARPVRATKRPGDASDAYVRDVPGGDFEKIAAAILRYDIFSRIEPVLRRAPLQLGDTVGARYRVGPGVALFFASRVVEVMGDPDRRGFRYATLEGHPECGEETFLVERIPGGARVSLTSWSRPGLWYTRLASPILRAVQVGASREALDHLSLR